MVDGSHTNSINNQQSTPQARIFITLIDVLASFESLILLKFLEPDSFIN